jgi:hypothetical protein
VFGSTPARRWVYGSPYQVKPSDTVRYRTNNFLAKVYSFSLLEAMRRRQKRQPWRYVVDGNTEASPKMTSIDNKKETTTGEAVRVLGRDA